MYLGNPGCSRDIVEYTECEIGTLAMPIRKEVPILVVAITALAGLLYVFWSDSGKESVSENPNLGAVQRAEKKHNPGQAIPKSEVVPGSLSGQVLGKEGQGLALASVSLVPLDEKTTTLHAYDAVTRSNEEGGWKLEGIAGGRYSLGATAPGFLPYHQEVEVVSGQELDSLILQLSPGGVVLSGVVSDALGGSLAGAVVHVLPLGASGRQESPQSVGTQAGAEGKYEINLASGNYLVWAFQEGYVSISHRVQVGADSQTRDFSLPPASVVEGDVRRRSDGSNVAHARVRYATNRATQFSYWDNTKGGGEVVADAKGHFRITGLHSGSLQISANGADTATIEPTLVGLGIGEERSDLVVYVDDAHTVRGRVVDKETRVGVAGIRVSTRGIEASELTDEQGGFELHALPSGSYRLNAEGGDYLARIFGESLVVDSDIEDVIIEVSRGVYVKGRVEPATQAKVRIELGATEAMGPNLLVSTETEKDGSFTLGPMSPASFSLVAESATGLLGRADVTLPPEGLSGVVIALEATGSVRGVVVDGKGKAQDGLRVSMQRKQGDRQVSVIVNGQNMLAKSSQTNPDGKFLIRGLEEGEYELVVLDPQGQRMNWSKGEGTAAVAPLEIAIGKEQAKTGLRLEVETRDSSIYGVVLGPDGSPAADIWVRVSAMSAMELMMRSGRPPPADLSDKGAEESRVESRTEMRMVVEDDGGSAGAPELDLSSTSELPPVLTNEKGEFSILDIKKGRYNLTAEGMRGTARAFMEVETDTAVEVKLATLTSIEGTVTIAGSAVDNFVVHLEGAMRKRKEVRSEEGSFVMHRIDPGEYTIRVTAKGGEATEKVVVQAGQVAKITLAMESLIQVEGKVVDESGTPIEGAIPLAAPMSDGGGMMLEVDDDVERTGAGGRFSLGVAPGKYTLVILGESGPMGMQPFEAKSGESVVDLGEVKVSQGAPVGPGAGSGPGE